MPYMMIQTNTEIDNEFAEQVVKKASNLVAKQLGKSENYVMVSLRPPVPMSFAGDTSPAAYIELKSINLPEDSTKQLSNAICQFIHDELHIDSSRVYIEFENAERHMWGWNGATF